MAKKTFSISAALQSVWHRSFLLLFFLFLAGGLFHIRESLPAFVTFQSSAFDWYALWDRPASTHQYRQDGLLVVGQGGKHPVLELIHRAEEQWMEKQSRASKTLDEAVAEYERRYKRLPPKGFEHWWKYAQDNNVQLPDEYDTIWRDLEPFWGISPEDFRKIQEHQESISDSFTIVKDASGKIGLAKVATSETNPLPWDHLTRGYDEILGLLQPVADVLPEFRINVSPHDNPNLVTDYHVKQAALEAAAAGKYVNLSALVKRPHLGFVSACPPDSPARKWGLVVDQTKRPPPREEKTIIHDHRASMDPCQNPYLFYFHAQFLPYPPGEPNSQPVMSAQFSYCNTLVHHNIQPPTFISWQEDVVPRKNDPIWENKTDERIYWRGSNTGMIFDETTPWRYSQRPRLVRMANDKNGMVTVRIPTGKDDSDVPFHEMEVEKKRLSPLFFDVEFSGRPIACSPRYCDFLAHEFEWYKKQDPNGLPVGNHKYVIDVDGNGWSSRFKRLITTNSLVFKATIYPEWWLDRIQPWVHYVPVQTDYSDIIDIFAFFRGGLYGEGNHDDLAKKIAYAGREWSKSYWRKEDMTAYFFRLLLEYSRIMSLDREAMTYRRP